MGCALIDVPTGLPLALNVAPAATLDSDFMGLLAAGAVAQFKRCEESSVGGGAGQGITELQVATVDAYYFMARIGDESDQLAMLVLDRAATNLGFGWMAMRRAIRELQDAYLDADETPSGFDHGDGAARGTLPAESTDEMPPPLIGAPRDPMSATPTRRTIRR